MSMSKKMEKMCRVCLITDERQSPLVPLFTGCCATSDIPTKIMNISNVVVKKEDGLPEMICQKCVFLVNVADCFKKQLRMADRQVRTMRDRTEKSEKTSSDPKSAGTCVDMDIEELAYDPEYISDAVKTEMENVFARKRDRDREFKTMSEFLKNLGKQTNCSPDGLNRKIILNEYTEDSIEITFDYVDRDCVANGEATNRKRNESFDNKLISFKIPAKGVKIKIADAGGNENGIAVGPEQQKKIVDSKESKTQDDSCEIKIADVVRQKLKRIVDDKNENGGVIVISDSSDDDKHSKVEKNVSRSILADRLRSKDVGPMRLSVSDEKKKLSTAEDAASKTMEEKKIFRTMKIVNVPQKKSKILPGTYFLCTSCNVNLHSVSAVLVHHTEVHSPESTSFRCRMCNKDYSTKSRLIEHFHEHAETQLYRCNRCNDAFFLKDTLMQHLANHPRRKSLMEPRAKRMRTNIDDSIEQRNFKRESKHEDHNYDKENKFTNNS